MSLADEFRDLLSDAVEDTGTDLTDSKEAIALYMAERATHLSTIAGEPGFGQAVIAERNSVALRAGLELSDDADAVAVRWVGFIGRALRIAAIALI